MAKIVQRPLKDGSISYKVEVRICGKQATRSFVNSREASRWAVSTEAAMREGRYSLSTRASRTRVADVIKRFFDTPPANCGNWLIKPASSHFLNFWKKHLGHLNLSDIGPEQIVKGRNKLLKAGRTPSTCNRYTSALSTMLQACVQEWFLLESNPARGVRRLKEDNERERFLNHEERKRLFKVCESDTLMKDVIMLALNTGARRSEIRKVKWDCIDFDQGFITFRITKNGDTREIPLTAEVLDILRLRFLHRDPSRGDWVFPSKRVLGPMDLRKRFAKVIAKAEIKDFRFHDFRHTAGTYLHLGGVSERTIAEILGHKTLQMVKRYTHMKPAHLCAAMEDLNQAYKSM